jgi:hypothetical protein
VKERDSLNTTKELTRVGLNKECLQTITFALRRLADEIVSKGAHDVTFGAEYKGIIDPDTISTLAESLETPDVAEETPKTIGEIMQEAEKLNYFLLLERIKEDLAQIYDITDFTDYTRIIEDIAHLYNKNLDYGCDDDYSMSEAMSEAIVEYECNGCEHFWIVSNETANDEPPETCPKCNSDDITEG